MLTYLIFYQFNKGMLLVFIRQWFFLFYVPLSKGKITVPDVQTSNRFLLCNMSESDDCEFGEVCNVWCCVRKVASS